MTMQEAWFSVEDLLFLLDKFIYLHYDRLGIKDVLFNIKKGNFPTEASQFENDRRFSYFHHWVSLITLEQIEEIIQLKNKGNHFICKRVHLFLATDGEDSKKIIVNVIEGEQKFRPMDGVRLSCQKDVTGSFLREKKIHYIFGEVTRIVGNVLHLNLTWPNDEETIALLNSVSEDHDNVDQIFWTAELFPNTLTYRRMRSALWELCMKDEPNAKQSQMVNAIIASLNSDDIERSMLVGSSKSTDNPSISFPTDAKLSVDGSQICEQPEVTTGKYESSDCLPNAESAASIITELEKPTLSKQAHSLDRDLNKSQREAVIAAVKSNLTLIQGPPGTGKTVTAVAILMEWIQCCTMNEPIKILATAETNEGVNNLASKLLDTIQNSEDLLRVGSKGSSIPKLNNVFVEVNCDDEEEKHWKSKKHISGVLKRASRARVICTTCTSSGLSILKNFQFKYVLVDEATQATEPKLLIPMTRGAERLCIIGDEKQLPPLVITKQSSELRKSLFERLQLSGHKVHMLNIQYRMHPDIAEYPSKEFYDSNLQTGILPEQRRLPKNFPVSERARHFPIVFLNVEGQEKTKPNKSKCNENEAKVVVDLVCDLLKSGDIDSEDIGVITPYSAQIRCLSKRSQHEIGRLPTS